MKQKVLILVMTSTLFLYSAPSRAWAENFFEGKTIRFVVGFSAGGGYDVYTRLVARYIGRHIPGNSATVVENTPGAGSLLTANRLFAKVKPDGLTVATFHPGLVMQQALGAGGIRFKADEFEWVGALVRGMPVCAIMGFTGLKTLEDVLKTKRELKFGGTRAGSSTNDLPNIMNLLMGTKINVISGYEGTSKIRLALQARELDGVCNTWDAMKPTSRAMLKAKGDGRLIPFIIQGNSQDTEVKDLPQFTDLIKGKEDLAAFKTVTNPYNMLKPLVLPPKTPRERVEIIRTALEKTLGAAQFKKEAEKSKLLIDPLTGEEVENLVQEILGLPSKAKEKLGFLVRKAKK